MQDKPARSKGKRPASSWHGKAARKRNPPEGQTGAASPLSVDHLSVDHPHAEPDAAEPEDPPKPEVDRAPRRGRFAPAGALIEPLVRKAGAERGFALAQILTDWDALAGPELAPLCRPLKISYNRKGFGATLVLEVPGAVAPLVQTRLEGLRARLNSAYGYAAIARIEIKQAAGLAALPGGGPQGMAEPPMPFSFESAFDAGMPRLGSAFGTPDMWRDNVAPPSDAALARARDTVAALTAGVTDPGLRDALRRLAEHVLTRDAKRRAQRGLANGTEKFQRDDGAET